MSASGACFDPEPPTPSKPASGPKVTLVYTHIWTELLRLGVSWAEAARMPWGVCRMLFEARAEAYDAAKASKDRGDVRYATQQDIYNWI